MDKTVMEFINTGKAFRASKNSGRVVIVEGDPSVRVCMGLFAKKLGRSVRVARTLNEADKAIGSEAVILVVGLDSQPIYDAKPFLKHVSDHHPSSFVIVYTSDADMAHALQTEMPRITTIVKGEGMDGLLSSLERQVPHRRDT